MKRDIVVVTSCTATKVSPAPGRQRRWAESLYGGQQHLRLMRGVRDYRNAGMPVGKLRLSILSAAHGLLASRSPVAPYDHTFAGLPVQTLREQAREQHVPRDVRDLLSQPFALALLLLGDPYLRACDLGPDLALGGPTIAFCSPASARRLPTTDGWHPVTLTNADAHRFSTGLLGLKGELADRLLARLAARPDDLEQIPLDRDGLLDWLERSPAAALAA